jgi:NAD-reducing hydrogenase large subunit
MKRITIEPVTRIEGHAKITIQLTTRGTWRERNFMSHKCAGSRDSRRAARSTRCRGSRRASAESAHQPLTRVVEGLRRHHGRARSTGRQEAAGAGAFCADRAVACLEFLLPVGAGFPSWNGLRSLRREMFSARFAEGLAQERVHPEWIVPGGVATPLATHATEHILSELPKAKAIAERTIQFFKGALDNYKEEIEFLGSFPSMYAGPVDAKGRLQLYDGNLRFRKATGELAEDQTEPDAYKKWARPVCATRT